MKISNYYMKQSFMKILIKNIFSILKKILIIKKVLIFGINVCSGMILILVLYVIQDLLGETIGKYKTGTNKSTSRFSRTKEVFKLKESKHN